MWVLCRAARAAVEDVGRLDRAGVAPELCDGIDDNCDGRNDGDADGGADPLAQAHCVAVWPYGADAAVAPRCVPPLVTMPCAALAGFACVGCRRVDDCYRQTQRPGQTVDIRACGPRS
jgi:hypothetical protein